MRLRVLVLNVRPAMASTATTVPIVCPLAISHVCRGSPIGLDGLAVGLRQAGVAP